MFADTNKIKHLVELALGQKIHWQPDVNDLVMLDVPNTNNELDLIKHYIKNQHLVNDQLRAELVTKHLIKPKSVDDPLLPPAEKWSEYLHKLETLLERVKYRRANNFEYNAIMPTQQQLAQLQHECWQLTEKWYGPGSNNLSCFYNYFVAMNQLAGVTCFTYKQIGKLISEDHALSVIKFAQRRAYFLEHDAKYKAFLQQGGVRPLGRSIIDGTDVSNVVYCKTAQLHFYYAFAKNMIAKELNLENYGQLPFLQRVTLWHLLQQHYPDNTADDCNNIFYKFVKYCNARPGEYFNYFGADLPEAKHVSAQTLHDIIKIVGLQSKQLCLFAREVVANWIPKRHFSFNWTRKYPLQRIISKNNVLTVRPQGAVETARILPNELPYGPAHGLSLCGNGLLHSENGRDTAYEWNTPIDQASAIDNWSRDIEKMFRELKIFSPTLRNKNQLLGETLYNTFHNTMAYSTIQTTQHTHIVGASIDRYMIYELPAQEVYELPKVNATFELVQVGANIDASYLRCKFTDLSNEPLIQFLMQLNKEMFSHFDGDRNLDVFLHLFTTLSGDYVFIFEPHAFLTQLDNDKFENPHNRSLSRRKPQFMYPDGVELETFKEERAEGLAYCRKFFDDTARPGITSFLKSFIHQFSQSQP